MSASLEAGTVETVVSAALAEDIGAGDVTCESVLRGDESAKAIIVSRQPGIIAGLPVAEEVFRQVSGASRFRALVPEGAPVECETRVAEVTGAGREILTAERVALNFLQRLSGIATLTRRCVDAVRGSGVKILDTRKTTPGLRSLEKYAVRVGGGVNHRMGLYDQVLIKDNHLRLLLPLAGDLPAAVRLAVERARESSGKGMRVEVEAESPAMVQAALEAGADIIMLDNMPTHEMREAASRVRAYREQHGTDTPITEASGGLLPETLAEVAASGVDAISLGALTHSAPVLDLAMELE